jgi:hypothetical protein
MKHEPTEMVFAGRSNRKHKHVSARGRIRYCNHWFDVYRCPVCGRRASHRRKPYICRGDDDA